MAVSKTESIPGGQGKASRDFKNINFGVNRNNEPGAK